MTGYFTATLDGKVLVLRKADTIYDMEVMAVCPDSRRAIIVAKALREAAEGPT